MTAYDRHTSLERQQIQEISRNVARRLMKVVERGRLASPAVDAHVQSTAQAIVTAQHEIDQIMTSIPLHEAVEISVLTHVLATQQQALSLLEDLEAKLPREIPAPERSHQSQTHAALIAAAREIEADAQRHAADARAALMQPVSRLPVSMPPGSGNYGSADPGYMAPVQRVPVHRAPVQRAPPPAALPPPHAVQAAPQPQHPAAQGRRPPPSAPGNAPPKSKGKLGVREKTRGLADVQAWLRSVIARPGFAAPLAAAGVMLLVAGIWLLLPAADSRFIQKTATQQEAHTKLDGRLATDDERDAGASETAPRKPVMAFAAPAGAPPMEQPYLVVLATRRTTDELQKAFMAYREAYPDLLGSAKARVDQLQGQDKQTWYRLSVIPPRSRDEAKALCSGLRAAGLSGCWTKQVPLR